MQNENNPDFLSSDYNIETPENVSFGYELAGIGSRFIAALIDTSILALALTGLNLLLWLLIVRLGSSAPPSELASGNEAPGWFVGLLLAIYALINFGLIWGYYVFFELRWNGQTPGKRAAGIRVVRADGDAAGLSEVVMRNLVRLVDFLPAAYGLGLVVMFCNSQARRLGDYAAGTLVVKEGGRVGLNTLLPGDETGPAARGEEGTPAQPLAYPEARLLSRGDYNLVCDVLERDRQEVIDVELIRRLARAIAARIGSAPPAEGESRAFLADVAESYRRMGKA